MIIKNVKISGRPVIINSNKLSKYVKKPIPIAVMPIMNEFEVETLEGVMKGKAGDYLIIGVENEAYPCDKKIFEKTYDKVI